MRDLVILFIHLLMTVARLARPGGVRSVVAESMLVKYQLLILNRSRQRAPNLRLSDRLVAGWCALFIQPSRLIRSAIILKPSTLLRLHQILTRRKYRLLFSPQGRRKPGPKGPSKELIDAIVATKPPIPPGAAHESLSRLVGPSAFPSIKTSFGASWPFITDPIRTPAVRPG
jgi:hypothetical protein